MISDTAHHKTRAKLLILTTGGTIAGSTTQHGLEYKAGQTSGQTMIDSIPNLKAIADIEVRPIAQIGSQDMSDTILLQLAQQIQQAEQDPSVTGILITHGTDTMEETAFFLDMVLHHTKPVVLTGAMRPPAFTSADGASNLINAARLAVWPQARHQPVMIVMNDMIFDARSAQKTHTTHLEAFQAPNTGPIGIINNHQPYFYHLTQSQENHPLPLPKQAPFPRVDIIYAHIQMDGELIRASVKKGSQGVILAGVGDGNGSASVLQALREASRHGVIIVRSSRVGSGFVNRNVEVNDDKNHFIAAADLNPQKARILLQLLLANHIHDLSRIQQAFYLSNQEGSTP